jgi:hypothetical protein
MVGSRLPFAARQSLLESLYVEKIETTGSVFVLVTFLYPVTPVWHTEPALQFYKAGLWINGFAVFGHPSATQIAYAGPTTIPIGTPWRILTRPVSLQIPPRQFPLPQTGVCIAPA